MLLLCNFLYCIVLYLSVNCSALYCTVPLARYPPGELDGAAAGVLRPGRAQAVRPQASDRRGGCPGGCYDDDDSDNDDDGAGPGY